MRTTTRPAVRTLQTLCVTVTAALLATGCGRSDDSGPGKDAPRRSAAARPRGQLVMWSMGDTDKPT